MTQPDVPVYAPLVRFTRGGLTESVHHGALAVVDRTGRLLFAAGDPMLTVFMRSSAKPFQALPLVADGGLAHWGLDDADLALFCASHTGSAAHTQRVAAILQRIGLGPDALQCGVHMPADPDAARSLTCAGQLPTPLHHNCSGKHTGMLARARLHGWDTASYLDPAHPLQRDIRAALARFAGLAPSDLRVGIDGCSAPNFALPLYHAAWAWARLMDPVDMDEPWAGAARRITQAMTRHPEMVGGKGRFDTVLMRALGPAVVAKAGAEGYQALGIRPGRWPAATGGVGIALKIADGDARNRARGMVALTLLQRAGLLSEPLPPALQPWDPRGPVTNWRGLAVGERQVLL